MEYSKNFGFALPSSDNDFDLADINELANNFRKVDEKAMKKEDVDQVYNPASENPQSGIAVAEAIENAPYLPTWGNSTLTTNKYIDYRDGREVAFTGLNVATISLFDAKKINYFHTSTYAVVGLAFYDTNNKYISGVHAEGQSVDIPDGAVTCKATVINPSDIALEYTLADLLNKNNEIQVGMEACIKDTLSKKLEIISGYYVDYRDGKVNPNASMSYIVINDVIGEKVYYSATVKTPDIRGIAFYNAYGIFLGAYRMLSTPQVLDIPKGTTCIKATVNTVEDVKRIVNLDDIIDYAEKQKSFNVLNAFSNITCIGDSLTWSQVYTSASGSRQAYNTYPKILAQKIGVDVTPIAMTGYSASRWWSEYAEQITQKENQLAIVYLGTNLGLTDTLETDAPNGTDFSTWADTNTGCYAKIVAKLQSVGCKVVLVQCFYTSGNPSATAPITNNVIEQTANRFGCGLVSPIYFSSEALHLYPDKTGTNAVHYNDLGYSAFTDALIHEIGNMSNEYMQNIIPN